MGTFGLCILVLVGVLIVVGIIGCLKNVEPSEYDDDIDFDD